MEFVQIILIVVAVLAALFFLITFFCFFAAFYGWKDPRKARGEFDLPPGRSYEPYYDVMREWVRKARGTPRQHVYITSFDGLKLHGTYYEYKPGAPIELMLHGCRGSAERDLCGGESAGHSFDADGKCVCGAALWQGRLFLL